MLRILHGTKIDFIKYWRTAAILTVAFIIIGAGSAIFTGGFPLSIEFTGGTLMQLEFTTPPDVAKLRSTLDAAGIRGAEITSFGSERDYTIRAQEPEQVASQASGAEKVADQIEAALKVAYGEGTFKVARVESVGPRVGAELARGAVYAILISFAVTLAYLAWRFEWRFGLAAVLATLHDILTTIAFIKLLHLEISLTVIAAILTVIGYSLNDTIIIFDRVRENLHKNRKMPFYDLLNLSVNETLPRSILTHATTLAATVSLLVLAGEVIRPFAWVMSFGIFTGTFSSIYVASPILMWVENKYPRANEARSTARVKP
ncbi:MAG: protein translocase subunit SecF [Gemmatimonadaceae bacterium]|nr:protein translocase subunit SecF [Gemmatimonadaceae bacterium]